MRLRFISQLAIIMVLTLFIASDVLAQDQKSDAASAAQPGLKYWNDIDKEAIKTESGLQYKVLYAGNGRSPKSNSKVKVHYRGLLLNGSTFDSSYTSDEPAELSLKSVIKGWKEGLQLMRGGSVYVFLIPPELAYGEKGSGTIPPNATLIFEIELF
ncbi:MAG: FKBP-type peptidyl-prolyl cis-trans isomerase [Gammaproteobacteria bacterium]|nr:FKBP-type peptidyl-prolyl cis-trans isomerase [Gammaproteobacteria bacterium]